MNCSSFVYSTYTQYQFEYYKTLQMYKICNLDNVMQLFD